MKELIIIAAVADNGVIGNNNDIPWYIPEDFKHFSQTTKGNIVIMGAKTWDSLPEKVRPLPSRQNIIISKTREEEQGIWVKDIDSAIDFAMSSDYSDKIYIIGGASIYEQTIDKADTLLLSEIPMEPEGDTFFPHRGDEWERVSEEDRETFTISTYKRTS